MRYDIICPASYCRLQPQQPTGILYHRGVKFCNFSFHTQLYYQRNIPVPFCISPNRVALRDPLQDSNETTRGLESAESRAVPRVAEVCAGAPVNHPRPLLYDDPHPLRDVEIEE